MKNLQLHQLGKTDYKTVLKKEYESKIKVVSDDVSLSKDEKEDKILQLKKELNDKLKKANWSLY